MKLKIRMVIILLGMVFTTAQATELSTTKVDVYNPKLEYGHKIFVEMNFANNQIIDAGTKAMLTDATILKAEIVYTDFPVGADLSALNNTRITKIKSIFPGLKADHIQWGMIAQTDCPTEVAARNLFHGVVITFLPSPTKGAAMREIELMIKALSGELTASIVTSETEMEYRIVPLEELWHTGDKGVTRTKYINIDEDTVHYVYKSDGPAVKKLYKTEKTIAFESDSGIFKVFKRHPEWSDMMVLCDVTGSMFPYTTQFLSWLQLDNNGSRMKQYVFFNDGDDKTHDEKVIGSTGGIYSERMSEVSKVQELCFKAMLAGSGGDGPENNLEAIIAGLEDCDDCEDIVMIADALAPVKDIELLKQIKRPIKVVLCGSAYGIHISYFELAKATGGSLHTMENDLIDLMDVNQGEEIVLGGQKYIVVGGYLIKVT
ncbi:MAG: hypothetical protein HRT71_11260 [Flavobacteriales bacterium]|nr:hypothetical protein [Flavobacteriales bacterium]